MTILSEEEQKKYLLSKIGESVVFKYPEPPYVLNGKLKDRWVFKNYEDDDVVYWNIMDLIKFENDNEDWLRMSYYRYKKKTSPPKRRVGWVFAGQTSLASPINQVSEFFTDAIKRKRMDTGLFQKHIQEMSSGIAIELNAIFFKSNLCIRVNQ